MVITFFAPRYHTNQTEIVKVLKLKGHQVNYLVLNKGETENYSSLMPVLLRVGITYRILSIFCTSLNKARTKRRFQTISVIQFWKLVSEEKTDTIIIRNPDTPSGLIALIVAKLKGIKTVLYHQSPFFGEKDRRTRFIEASNIILNTKSYTPVLSLKESDEKTISRDNYFIPFPIPELPIDHSKFTSSEGSRILSVGKFQPRKKFDLLISAFSKFNDKSITLTIIGECSNSNHYKLFNALQKLVSKLGIKDQVSFKKNIPHKEMRQIYSEYDLLVFPSINEPFGYSTLEAIGAGLAVISSDSNGSKYFIEEGKNGCIFKGNSIEDLYNKMKLIIDRDLSQFKSESLRIKDVYSNDLFYAKFSRLLQ